MADEVSKEPVPLFITGAASILSAVNGFTSTLGVTPFWSDSVVGILLCLIFVFWVYRFVSQCSRNRQLRGMLANLQTTLAGTGTSLGTALIVLILTVWTVRGPATQLLRPNWTFCGRIANSCSTHPCVVLYDWRGRKIKDECNLPADDSNYFNIRPDAWYIYKPSSFAVDCGGKISQQYSADRMFQQLCDSVFDLR
jgi:hypothetical protein